MQLYIVHWLSMGATKDSSRATLEERAEIRVRRDKSGGCAVAIGVGREGAGGGKLSGVTRDN